MHSWQWPWPCVPNLVLSPSALEIDVDMVMTGVRMFGRFLVGYMVSYFVTVLALVDQLLINVFMLWEHDGYMADDRVVHHSLSLSVSVCLSVSLSLSLSLSVSLFLSAWPSGARPVLSLRKVSVRYSHSL
jgi:hypothetical protein